MAEASREYKIILIGDPNVGKTCYFLRVRDGNFIETDELRTTVLSGVEFLQYSMDIDGCKVSVRLHDTGGGERFRTLTSNFYRNADAAILVYSVEDRFTFENLQEWYENASEALLNVDNFVWGVVGNKVDLPIEVETESVDDKCKSIGTELNFLVSAKTGEMVKESLEAVIREVHKQSLARRATGTSTVQPSGLNITQASSRNKKSGCC